LLLYTITDTHTMGRRGAMRATQTLDRARRLVVAGTVGILATASGAKAAAVDTLATSVGEFTVRDLTATRWTTEEFTVGGSNITASARLAKAQALSSDIAHIIAELSVSTIDWTDIVNDYTADYAPLVEGTTSITSNEWTRLQAVPLTLPTGSATAVASTTPITDYVTAIQTYAATPANAAAAKEMIEKTLWDATIYQAALKHLATAQDDDNAYCVTNTSQTDATIVNWDIGAAFIIGDGYHSILGRANKRAAEFGTMSGSVAKTYEEIVKLLRAGQLETDCPNLHEIYEGIEKQMRVVYSQSIIKYAYKIDAALAAGKAHSAYLDDHAEGQALYRVIAGDIHGKDTDSTKAATTFFNALFDMRSAPTVHSDGTYGNYCKSISYLMTILGLTADQIGTYADAANVDCTTAELSTSGSSSSSSSSSTELTTLAGSYFPSSQATGNVDFEAAKGLSANIAHIIAEINSFTTDWSDITNDFNSDYKKWTEGSSLTSNEWTRLLATPLTGGDPSDLTSFAAATSTTPLSDYIADAVAQGQLGTYRAAAKEMIEKTVWDATIYHGALKYLASAQEDSGTGAACVTSTSSQSSNTKLYWDIGAALIIGDGYHSILGRANKRGAEFGTMNGAVADTYEKIVKLLRDGQEQKNCDVMHEDIYEAIEKQMRIVYGQSIIKYAYKIDKGIKDKTLTTKCSDDQAEGQALYRVIAGDIKAKGADNGVADHYKFFNTLFDVRSVPTKGSWDYANYCTAITYVREALGMKDESLYNFGTYHEARHIDCEAQVEYSAASYAELVAIVHGLKSVSSSSSTDVRPAEALAAFSFIVAVAGVVIGSIALHKVRRGAGGYKSSYVIQNI
jgi:hypothetical protein